MQSKTHTALTISRHTKGLLDKLREEVNAHIAAHGLSVRSHNDLLVYMVQQTRDALAQDRDTNNG